jgi:flagellar motor switch protein FliM
MTDSLKDKTLTRDKLRQLINLAKKHASPQEAQADTAQYDWQQPHRFNMDQLAAMDNLVKGLTGQVVETFQTLCQGDFEATAASVSQHFAHAIAQEIPTEKPEHYFLAFTTDDNTQCGFIGVSPETALILVGLMLRDPDIAAREDKKLSGLEESILIDITAAVIGALETCLKGNTGLVFQRASQLVKGRWPLDFNKFEDLIAIPITVNHPDSAAELTFTVLSDIIEPVLGTKTRQNQQLTNEQVRNMIMQHMYEAPIDVTARLGFALMHLSDVMNLCVGDVLLFDTRVNEPIDVLVNNRRCFAAHPATSAGRYAVVIGQSGTAKLSNME